MAATQVDYKSAGVDVAAADEAKSRIRALVESTFTYGVRGRFGAFGGMFRVPEGFRKPLLVSSADGVGSKVKLAIEAGRHVGIGQDIVNHCVNDIVAHGARPLFFLDYVAFGKLDGDVLHAVVEGIALACRENGCALIGGETAEMPDLYEPPDYDLAGFIVGCVEEESVLGAHRVQAGDVLLGLPSSGLHTNGYSLARRIVRDHSTLQAQLPGTSESMVDALLRVHRSYYRALEPVLGAVHALAHITGGGLPGNLNRVLPVDLDAVVRVTSWEVPALFRVLQEAGGVSDEEMFRTFNMGVGMVAVVPSLLADDVGARLRDSGCDAWLLGDVKAGSGRVVMA